MKVPEQITKAGLQIQKLNCGGLQIRRNWNNLNDALVYGTIQLTRYPNNQVRGNYDSYDFEMHKGSGITTWLRNKATQIGAKVAGEGVAYIIYFNGSKTLSPLWPWTK
ncbi:MAG: hypothetical protein IKQ94_08060 [Bacteroidales bacterium]|nr:hypothetical protein [Bacteroidales bacterium]